MTYASALRIARERSKKSGLPTSTELYRLLAANPAAYSDYLSLRNTTANERLKVQKQATPG